MMSWSRDIVIYMVIVHGLPLRFEAGLAFPKEQLLRDSCGTHVEHPAMSSVVYLCEDAMAIDGGAGEV